MAADGAIRTIGYEGTDLPAVVAALRDAGVATLVDVRAVPWSRKPGFSRRALEAGLREGGIGYVHLPALGNPARHAAGGIETWGEAFREHLSGAAANAGLAEAAAVAEGGPICLMCLERDPATCHRSLVADALAGITGRGVLHLTPERTGGRKRPVVRDLFDEKE